jgi:hypothetical protein
MKTNTLSLLFIPFLSYFSLSQTAQARNPEIDRLRDEVIALNAKLITDLTEAVTSIGNDVELVHASILAVRPETVDTAAAYSQAKSLIADLDVLRRHAIADLTLLSDYTPPDVPPPTALAGTSTDPESALASTYQDSPASDTRLRTSRRRRSACRRVWKGSSRTAKLSASVKCSRSSF